ncbi:MAG: hypothetical protein CMB80_31550 [Flammeovirgaceae bacterium]|nr:hypothetical protein [Flammeovirgaceae bacterium]MBR06621.1 hypothetical protein [Rickettsiales bacterium]HCX24105.1 hypothetical protein [Cytophagales bacterium]
MQRLLTYSTILVAALFGHQAYSQDEGFMYGKVTTIDGKSYEGALRWNKEEAYWTDMFNASKDENENLDYLSRDEIDELEERRRGVFERHNGWVNVSWTWDYDDDFVHQFACQFGEIKSIRPTRRQGAEVTMQNGVVYDLDGQGYNDINTDIKVVDAELGIIEIDWDRIELIEFKATPSKLKEKFGSPLYGIVETSEGEFKGYIQWDHDERVSEDKLDGDTEDGDVSISFSNIKSIERYGSSRSIVILKSGRELELRGSNDVNDENRGIIVAIEGLGRIDVPWDEFDKVTFMDAPGSGPAYKTFADQTRIVGMVELRNGDQFTGELIYDLDEAYQYEVLQGMLDDVEMIIPFKYIREIAPKNYDNCSVTLTNGEKYLLGDSQDVSDKNQGVLVKKGGEIRYFSFEDIEKITFN